MPRKDIYFTDEALVQVDKLASRWGLSRSATVARAVAEVAVKEQPKPKKK